MSLIFNPRMKPRLGTPLNKSIAHKLGLVGCWPFNEGGGNKVFDAVQGLICNIINAPSWVPGKYGSSIHFNDGADCNQCGIVTSASPFSFGTGNFSVSWFVKYPLIKVSGVDYSGIIADSKWNASASNPNCWALTTGSSVQPSAINYYDIGDSTGSYANYRAMLNNIPDGWHHFVFIRDVQNMRLKLYQNGTLVYNSAFTNLSNLIAGDLWIARSSDTRYTGGIFSHCFIFKRVLSASEVAQDYREPFYMFQREPIELWAATSGEAGISMPLVMQQMNQFNGGGMAA